MVTAARVASGDSDGREHFRVELPTDLSQVGVVVEAVVSCCQTVASVSTRTEFRLCTMVAEAVANAMVNGNRNDPARRVTVDIEFEHDRIIIAVSDEGEGFDPAAVPDPTHDAVLDSTRGRGLFMIRSLADHVAFNDRGNTIWMTLTRC
ncbi:MAG: ATP-binding protein [Gemmatimonadales bacterium]